MEGILEAAKGKVEGILQERCEDESVRCNVCQRRCAVLPGKMGWCRTRINDEGTLCSLTYGKVSSMSINPIEKKPVYHFLPGSKWLSLGSIGCNFRCPGCQNFEIAHVAGPVKTFYLGPEEVVDIAEKNGCSGISWTFNEPALWFEYTLEGARLAKERGLFTNYVTNGFMTDEALSLIAKHLDVYRVDVKAFSSDGYLSVGNVREFRGILSVTEMAKNLGIHVEVVTNLIHGLNDDREQLGGIASWIAKKLGVDTPWHVTRFYPQHQLSHLRPTPAASMERAVSAGMGAGLRYVYVGNDPGHRMQNTFCSSCKTLLVARNVFDVVKNRIEDGACPDCKETVPGKFN